MTIGSLSCTLLGSRPPGRLARYAAAFPTAEFNGSFYRWPRPSAFRHWRRKLPDGFRLSVKAPRGLTHRRKLDAPETWMQHIGAGGHERGGRRAVLLAQLAPSHARDDARLGYSLQLVPAGYGSRPNSAIPAGIARKCRGYLMARLGCFFLNGRGAWPGDLPGSGD